MRTINTSHIVGRSPIMQSIFDKFLHVAKHDVPVLIEGESGTGKELFARHIHYNSARKDCEFVVINCSALPDNLLESELFGHLKGAFTGAIKEKKGLFEVADNGTFFLDEIGDMSPALQVKLLRVLQEGTFLKIGGISPVRVNLRIIAATNKSLEEMVKAGKFREDVYYRINVVHMKLPPLRARREDIPHLIDFFLGQIAERNGVQKLAVDDEAMNAMQRYEWPGNVRQLENEIEKSSIFAQNNTIRLENLSPIVSGFKPQRTTGNDDFMYDIGAQSLNDIKKEYIEMIERRIIAEGLVRTGGNRTACAQLLQISRGDLLRKIARYGLAQTTDKIKE